MDESYPAMTMRHKIADDQMYQQDEGERYAGPDEYQTVAPPDPDRIQDCTNCRYATNSQAPYWCSAHSKMTYGDGVRGCSGWSWDPKDAQH